MDANSKMNKYFQFNKSTEITLCDCIIDGVAYNPEEVIFHLPRGVVSCGLDESYDCNLSLNVRFNGCSSDSVLCYKTRQFGFFGKRFKISHFIDISRIKKLLDSGVKIQISEELFAYKRAYFEGFIINKFGELSAQEIIIKLDDVECVDFLRRELC